MEPKLCTGNASFTFFRPRKRRRLPGLIRAVWANCIRFPLLVRLLPPNRREQRRYHISLCLMFKDEAPYLREWLEYHLLVGADHFYLYDNNSSDGFEEVIRPYLEAGLVTLIRWPQEHAQTAGYEDCIRRFQGESDWIGFIDVDEFLVPVEEESLVSFLDRFSHRPSVLIYWRFFGSGGMQERDVHRLVTEDFVVASEKLYTKGKCFFNSNYDYAWGHPANTSMFHNLLTVNRGIHIPQVDIYDHFTMFGWYQVSPRRGIPIQLNHYAVKSLAEHRQKDVKGDVFYDHPTHGDDVFYQRDRRCTAADYRIYRFLTELKERLALRDKSDEN